MFVTWPAQGFTDCVLWHMPLLARLTGADRPIA